MSEQTASRGLSASPRTLDLLPRALPVRGTPDGVFTAARLTVDAVAYLVSALAVSAWAQQPLRSTTLLFVGIAAIAGFAAAGLYAPRPQVKPLLDLRQILTVTAIVVMLGAAVELAFGREGVGDGAIRLWLLTSTAAGAGRVSLLGLEQLVRRNLARNHGATLIVGAGRIGHLAAQRLLEDPTLGLHPVGFLDKEPLGEDEEEQPEPHVALPVLGASWDLEEVVRAQRIEHVLVAFSTAPNHVVLDVVRRCWRLGVSVMVVPRLFEVEGRRSRTQHLGALPLVTLSPSDPQGWQFQVKYGIDRVVAGLTLLLLSPLVATIALAIVLDSGRPIFFRQRRVGRDGHVFEMLKFRTMSGRPEHAGEFDADWAMTAMGTAVEAPVAAPADRRTAVGHLLRRTSLDELPQLWNVFRGDMSLIGPRPERLHYVELFEQSIYRYPDRHRVKSGLTGWAQVNGLRGNTSLADRIEWDNFYIENWSPWLDLKILLKTIPALLSGRGAQ
jgi:exopolysaccharide biosynthesis polyprenyl glycosylphosphotransferase